MVNPLGSKNQYKVLDANREYEDLGTGPAINLELPHGASVYATGLQLFEPEIDISKWSEIGSKLSTVHSGTQWAIGDWWVYGFRRYGERAHKVAETLPYTKESLMNLGTVARCIPPSLRNEALSFSHHVAVAPLAPEDQKEWLKRAAVSKWPVKTLRDSLKKRDADIMAREGGFDLSSWAHYLIRCAQRPYLLVQPDESGVLADLDLPLLHQVVEASMAAASLWARTANAAQRIERERMAKVQPTKPKIKREKIVYEQAAE